MSEVDRPSEEEPQSIQGFAVNLGGIDFGRATAATKVSSESKRPFAFQKAGRPPQVSRCDHALCCK